MLFLALSEMVTLDKLQIEKIIKKLILISIYKMDEIKAIFNWSGGKDSALCLYETLMSEHISIISLVTTINQEKGRISMHGVRTSLLECNRIQ